MSHLRQLARRVLVVIAISGLITVGTAATAAPDAVAMPSAGSPEAAAWQSAVAATAPAAGLDPSLSTPNQVRQFLAGLTEAQRLDLVQRAPGVMGNLDGVPHPLRYKANEHTYQATNPGAPPLAGHLLGYDPRGDGHVIQVFGDLGTADRVAVMIPGCTWNLERYLSAEGQDEFVTEALALRDEMARVDPSARVAVISWLGYDPPDGTSMELVRSERAIAGVADLNRFVAALPRDIRTTLLCHSYAAVLCGNAAAGTSATDIVALAAPGMDVASAAGLGTSAQVWAAQATADPIRFVPNVRLAGFGHGAEPTDPGFGARVLRTGSAREHDNYYAPGTESLTNVARIVLGQYSEVTLVDHA